MKAVSPGKYLLLASEQLLAGSEQRYYCMFHCIKNAVLVHVLTSWLEH